MSLPNTPNLIGVQFYNQWVIYDPKVNNLRLVFSNGGAGKVG